MEKSPPRWTPSSFEERNYYDGLFQLADGSSNGKLAGQPAVAFLEKSGLAISILKQVKIFLVHLKECIMMTKIIARFSKRCEHWACLVVHHVPLNTLSLVHAIFEGQLVHAIVVLQPREDSRWFRSYRGYWQLVTLCLTGQVPGP